jgi:hypothetical protein
MVGGVQRTPQMQEKIVQAGFEGNPLFSVKHYRVVFP